MFQKIFFSDLFWILLIGTILETIESYMALLTLVNSSEFLFSFLCYR